MYIATTIPLHCRYIVRFLLRPAALQSECQTLRTQILESALGDSMDLGAIRELSKNFVNVRQRFGKNCFKKKKIVQNFKLFLFENLNNYF